MFSKTDYEARKADPESALDVKPLRVVQVESSEDNIFDVMNVAGFYCFKYCEKC